MKKIYRHFSIALVTAGLMVGCSDDLDIGNGNNADFARVYATGTDVENVAGGIYNSIFAGEHMAGGVEPMLGTAADHITVSWGNFGFRDMSWEPRDFAWNNQPTYANQGQTKYTYDKMYAAILTASNVLQALDNGVQIGVDGADNDRAAAVAKFCLGYAYGNLALLFDKAHIVDNVITVEETVDAATPYPQVAEAAIAYLEEAKDLAAGDFELPAAWFGVSDDITSADFVKMINTIAARILAYVPRNSTELAAVDWEQVQAYADAGITTDWTIQMDGTTTWYMEAGDYMTFPGWGRTDMRVVHMMDPTQPEHWEDSPTFPHPPASTNPIDQRLFKDFQYMSSNDFNPTRGYYHFTNYRSKRYDAVYASGVGPKPTIMAWENEMLRAEARVYQDDLAGAAAIINAANGPRVSPARGDMDPVAEDKDDIIQAIHHERHVEMYTTGMGLQFFEMRKRNLLQKGTPLHFPIPAQILQLFGETTFYTFGTTAKADGIGTSNAGWR